MKMIYITANISVLPQIKEILEDIKVNSYQIVERAAAKPERGDRRMDTAVWPGYNSIVFVQVDQEKHQLLNQKLLAVNQQVANDNELIFWASWQLEVPRQI